MTVLESLRNRAGLIVSGAVSFALVLGAMRMASGQPLVQPQADIGIVLGVALVTAFLVFNDVRGAKP